MTSFLHKPVVGQQPGILLIACPAIDKVEPIISSCRLMRNGFLILLAGGCALLFQQRLDPPAGAAQ